MSAVKQHFAGKSNIIFDSGGYAVQQGLIAYEDLYGRLLDYYRRNDWANSYVLPDYVPTSDLSAEEVEGRVNATISVARLFFAEMPAALRPRVLPVVQGYTRKQILACVQAYVEMGAQTLGFGSFGTTGAAQDINIVTEQSVQNLSFLLELGERFKFRVHAFGVGSPMILPRLHNLGIDSFDSSCWLRTAGFGNVFMPFAKRRSISGGRLREKAGNVPLSAHEFHGLQQETEHSCFFCQSFEDLKRQRFYQILHNLAVMMDSVERLNNGSYYGATTSVETTTTSRIGDQ